MLSDGSFTTKVLAFTGDGATLVVGTGAGIARWSVKSPAAPVRLSPEHGPTTAPVNALARLSRTGRMLVADDDGAIADLIPAGGAAPPVVRDTLLAPNGPVWSVAISEAGRTAASGTVNGLITLWSLDDRAAPAETGRLAVTDDITDLARGLDRTVLVADSDGVVSSWDLTDPTEPARVPEADLVEEYTVNAVSAAVPSGLVATRPAIGTLQLWTLGVGPARRRHELSVADFSVGTPEFLPGSPVLAAGSAGGELVLWDVANPDSVPAPTVSPSAQTGSIEALAVSADGWTVALASSDDTITLWDVDGARLPTLLGQPLPQHNSTASAVVFGREGHMMVSGAGDGSVILWDVTERDTPEVVATLPSGNEVTDLTLSADDRTLAVARRGSDPRGRTAVTLWDVVDPTAPKPLGTPMFSSGGRSYVLQPSDQPILLVTEDPAVHVLDLAALVDLRRDATRLACGIIGDALGPARWAQLLPDVPFRPTCEQ